MASQASLNSSRSAPLLLQASPELGVGAGTAAAGTDDLQHLRDLRPKNKLRSENPEDFYKRITRVQGTVMGAKNLANTDTWSRSDPYCVVKGIRASNHYVDIHVTRAHNNTQHPVWEEDFVLDCPNNWGLVDLVGLKFLVYDSDERFVSYQGSDDFLGGADVDLSDLRTGKSVSYERDLDGGPRKKSKSPLFKLRKPRINVKITVFHEWSPRPLGFNERLLASLESFQRASTLECHIVRARNLPNMDVTSKSDAVCVVRAVFLTGVVQELHRTVAVRNSLDPTWHERFRATFPVGQEPILLMFDLFDEDEEGTDVTQTGDHLGSAWASFLSLKEDGKRRLELLGDSQLLESLLNEKGLSMKALPDDPRSRGTHAIVRIRKFLGSKAKSTLIVECNVELTTEEMPHAMFLRKPQEIREEGDANLVLPAWHNSMFKVPDDIRKFQRGERARAGMLVGKGRIVFVSGVVHGASALPAMDANGKSDPYCIVEGISNHGDRIFVHRTRILQRTLNPGWHESFYQAVPVGMEITKLMFSIYDSDVSQPVDDEDDRGDFCGNATVDLTYIVNGELLHEDIPLVGAQRGHRLGVKSSFANGFRRSACITVEVRVEHRVMPVFERYALGALDWSPRDRHVVSRKPATLGYADPSQEELERMSRAPRKVLQLFQKNQLAASKSRRRYGQWLQGPMRGHRNNNLEMTSRPSTAADLSEELQFGDPELDEAQPEQQQRPQTSDELYDFASLRPASQARARLSASLPGLHTNFTRPSTPSLPDLPPFHRPRSAAKGGWLSGLQFRDDFASAGMAHVQAVCQKPPLIAMTQVRDNAADPPLRPMLLGVA